MARRSTHLSLTRLDDRLTPTSGLDPTFGVGGIAQVAGDPGRAGAPAEAGLPDGSVLVAALKVGGGIVVTRFTPAGVADPAFGTAGVAIIGTGEFFRLGGIAGGPDGSVYVLTSTATGSGARLFKLAAGGSPATDFPAAGVMLGNWGVNFYYLATRLAVRSDGAVGVVHGTSDGHVFYSNVSVYTPAGAPDPNFGVNGSVDVQVTGSQDFSATLLAADNRLLVIGQQDNQSVAVRLTPAGAPDPGFGDRGRVVLSGPDYGPSIVNVTPDGGLVFGLVVQTGRNDPQSGVPLSTVGVRKLTADGTADPTFGDAGRVDLPQMTTEPFGFGTPYEVVVSVRPDGGLLVLTLSYVGHVTLDVLTPAGTPDTRFGGDGRLGTPNTAGGLDLFSHRVPLAGGRVASVYYSAVADNSPLLVAVLAPYDDPADLNGDGTAERLVTAGPTVSLVSGADGSTVLLPAFAPFEASYTGTLNVVLADVDGDGRAELIVSPDQGGGPVVAVYRADGTQLARFWGIDDPAFRGGDRVAAGDLDGDGAADLVVTAGEGGGPRVAVFDGRRVMVDRRKMVADFFAFEAGQRGGANVAVGDLNGDGRDDVAFGAGMGGGPRVTVLDGRDLVAGGGKRTVLYDAFAGDPARRDGVRVRAAGSVLSTAVGTDPAAAFTPLFAHGMPVG